MEKTLQKIDDYLSQKTQSQTSMVFFGVPVIIALLVYVLSFDSSLIYFDDAKAAYDGIESKLTQTKDYISSKSSPDGDTNYEINRQKASLKLLDASLKEKIELNIKFDEKLQSLSFLIFDEQNWSKFLDSLVSLAKLNNIEIVRLVNEFKNPGFQKVEQFLNIELSVSGKFRNLVQYVNDIEKSDLVVDVSDFKIDSSSDKAELSAKFNISVWGMKYR